MVTAEEIEARKEIVESSDDLRGLLERLTVRAEPLLTRRIVIPEIKALLSADGGVCPKDQAPLLFDPWSPDRHVCSLCGEPFGGVRHHANWARAQHLWVAERAAHLATVGIFAGRSDAVAKARELVRGYYDLYFALPNRDNVLGPTRLFFSTYLESLWVTSYFGAAFLLREMGALDDSDINAINLIADEAANLIGEFNEGMSNRQTWGNAALTALAVWFGDEELARDTIEGPTGLLAHLTDGFGPDGMWFEGENYHLFAIRGLLVGLGWARVAGADLLQDPALAAHLSTALLAPARTALPDLTFPARKDSRYGVSLSHPAYLECWETGYAWLGESASPDLASWLQALYARPVTPAVTYDAYLHEAGETVGTHRSRRDLSWWGLLTMAPELPAADSPWEPGSEFLPGQGLAVLRRGARYVSLECGRSGGGHGHADRLHLTLHDDGVHWLPDPAAGSYVARDLFWYRSTLAHNAPRLDGESQAAGDARCLAYEAGDSWSWVAGRFGDLTRYLVTGPDWILAVTEVESQTHRTLEVPWHPNGPSSVTTPGTWQPAELVDEFVTEASSFTPAAPGASTIEAAADGPTLRLVCLGGTLLRASTPGLPGSIARQTMYLQRGEGLFVRFVTVLDAAGAVTAVADTTDGVVVSAGGTQTTIRLSPENAVITGLGAPVTLGGSFGAARPAGRLFRDKPLETVGRALRVEAPPALDGTLDGFDTEEALEMADESHYLRSEDPYPGPETLAATAVINWDEGHLYVGIEVIKPDVVIRPLNAPPLALDNEPDDIHADGVQVHYQMPDGTVAGYLIRPVADEAAAVRALTPDSPPVNQIRANWQRTDDGYCLTAALPCTGLSHAIQAPTLRFDLLVNEMRSDRVRRAGQLVWSGTGGWVYLRGDRHPLDRFGVLECIG